MTENEFILEDRKAKIKSVVEKYGEDKFILSFSGGKDSTVLNRLIDLAIPDNKLTRVYSDTGIEYNINRQFVYKMAENDDRFVIVKPKLPIKKMLEEVGYPFKSKEHSQAVDYFQTKGIGSKTVERYIHPKAERKAYGCPDILKYQFEAATALKFKVSLKCCKELKKKPITQYQKDNGKPYKILGIRHEEGGLRKSAKCLAFKEGELYSFNPLIVVTEQWINWFVKEYKVELSALYYPPFSFERTGCKGCPFNLHLQDDLDVMERLLPAEKKQCEYIWKPVYDEYRRLGYRLRKNDTIEGQMSIEDFLGGKHE